MKITFSIIAFISICFNFYLYQDGNKYKKLALALEDTVHSLQQRKLISGLKTQNLQRRPLKSSTMKLSQTNIDTLTDNKKDGQLNSKENTTEELFMSDENNDPDLALDTYEVEKENWETGIRDFFVERLQLEDKEFEVYKSSMKALDTRRAELYNKFLDNYDNATELPFVPSYEEEVALKEIELDIIRGLEKTIGQEKLKSLMEYERQMKVKMLQEKGYYNDYGIF